MIKCYFERDQDYYVDPSGISYLRLEYERIMPFIFNRVPEDLQTLLYVGLGGEEGPPAFIKRFDVKTLDIEPATKPDIVDDIRATSLSDASFDIVFLPFVLEHIYEKDDVIKECLRLLTPGGWLIVAVPWTYLYHGQGPMLDYWRISPDALAQMLVRAGFTDVGVNPPAWGTYGWGVKAL